MSNFELIDDYLGNRLSEAEAAAFEKQAASDPSLKSDLDIQKQIVEGVRNARKVELKAMLNNIPVGGSAGSGVIAGKIAASIIAVGVIGSLVYYAVAPDKQESKPTTEITAPVENKPDAVTEVAPQEEKKAEEQTATTPTAPSVKAEKKITKVEGKKTDSPVDASKNTEVNSPAAAQKPKIEVMDPSADMETSKTEEKVTTTTGKASNNASRIAVDTDSANKKYNFHYRFSGNKLMLYGPFDKSLYEILEINGDNKSVFLYYKNTFYLLSEKQTAITPLEAIKDPALVKKVKEYRENNKN